MTLRERLTAIIESRAFNRFIIGVIIFNAAILGVETAHGVMARWGDIVVFLDKLCLGIFVVELAAKLVAYRLRFFRSGWNLFDFAIVGISLVPGAETLSVLRALRILRVLRVVSAVPSLRRVVEGFLRALPGMGSVFLLMGMVFYVGSVIATNLYGEDFPELFGGLGPSSYTLFQVMTLENWSDGVVRPVMEIYPYAWAFFFLFILVTTFAIVNLVVGLIVNSMQDAHDAENADEDAAFRVTVMERLAAIERKLDRRPE